jgi:ABC-type lipoprotein release transport system permease subunit
LGNAGSDIFGTSDDILVYYNEQATTPFTSQIPVYLSKSFEQVNGVQVVNPEIFQPVIIKDSTAYIRGTNYTKLLSLENGKVLDGKIPDDKQVYQALVGKDLATRLKLGINDTVSIESIVSDQIIPIKIVGKYSSGKLATSDELLVSPEIARAIAGFDETVVTHIRVKFDRSVISRQEIIDQALKLYQIRLNLIIGNNTEATSRYAIRIPDLANPTVYNAGVKE